VAWVRRCGDQPVNFLAHLYLADGSDASLLGNLLGDFVKGSPEDLVRQYDPELVRGLINHRRVDAFTDAHPKFQAARKLVSPARRRYGGILVDLCFDHYLARDWHEWADETLDEFVCRAYGAFRRNWHRVPEPARPIFTRMMEQDWLGSYRTVQGISEIMDRMAARRLKRPNPFQGAGEELVQNYAALEECFRRFFPALVSHVAG
jgi:acyl carrier protein phosphodiesterase